MRTVYSLRIARAQFISFTETLPTTARNFSSTVCTGLYSVVHQYIYGCAKDHFINRKPILYAAPGHIAYL